MKLLPNTVINFHAVNEPDWMDRFLLYLKHVYTIIPLLDLGNYYEGKPIKNACHLTFDDGDLSFYKIVFPLITKHKIPVSVFISPKIAIEQQNFWFQEIQGYCTKRLKKIISKKLFLKESVIADYPLNALLKQLPLYLIWEIIEHYQLENNAPAKPPFNMNVEQVKEIYNSGLVSVGAHTLNHSILQNESDEISKTEIMESIDGLSDILNHRVNIFAYPNGKPGFDFGDREFEILKLASIKYAFSTEVGFISRNDNLLSIPRQEMLYASKNRILFNLLLGRKYNQAKKKLRFKREEDYRKEIKSLLLQSRERQIIL